MKKSSILPLILLVFGCRTGPDIPSDFAYKEIKTETFTLASWQKINDRNLPIKIYIEGDGHSFTSSGMISQNPTPHGYLLRDIAFGDNNQNVVYLARPCQYIKTQNCTNKYWSNARFAPEVVESMAEAVKKIAGNQEVILVGYSGGAQIAGLIGVLYPDIATKKVVSIAGNLDHEAWMKYHHLPLLDKSLNLADYKTQFSKIKQVHYVGAKDNIIPLKLTYEFVESPDLIKEIKSASHGDGWEKVYSQIRSE